MDRAADKHVAQTVRGNVLEIIGANTTYYHGARAYFDGDYCKTGPLDDKRKAELMKAAEAGAAGEK